MSVTREQMREWNRVQQAATLRKLEQARMAAVRQILEARKAKDARRAVQSDMLTERAA